MSDAWLSPKHYAAKYDLSIRTVYAWISQKRIPCVRVGVLVRVQDTREIQPRHSDHENEPRQTCHAAAGEANGYRVRGRERTGDDRPS